ncbi:sodium:solute symporter family transporter [Candidatus Mycoplasma pogonae]
MVFLTQTEVATEPTISKAQFTWYDWLILALYMLAMLGMGFFFWWQEKRNKNKSSSSYLVAKGLKIPAIVVALSIYATGLSSLTFLATPGQAFATGWMWIVAQLSFLAAVPILIKWVIPFYRRIKENTAYAYLEKRFNYAIRAISATSFSLFHIFRIAIVLFIPALTLSLFVDMNIYLILTIVGIIVIVGTFLGGFKGVLWTDAVQGFVLISGIILMIIFGLAKTDWEKAQFQKIFTEKQWYVTAASGGMFFLFVGKFFETLFSFTASQDIVQRYKTSKMITDTNKTIYINVILTIVTVLLFYGMGSVFYSYFSGEGHVVDGDNAISGIVGREGAARNQLTSFFIIKVLPAGISGLIIAAVFAASQSTISSSINSLVNVIISDFVVSIQDRLLKKGKITKPISDFNLLVLSKALIVFFGIQGLLVSFVLAWTKQDNLIDLFLQIVGLFGIPIAGLFMLGLLTKKTNSFGALFGVISAFLTSLILFIFTQDKFVGKENVIKFASEYRAIVAFAMTVILGYGASIVAWGLNLSKKKDLTNLTIYTKTAEFNELINLEKRIAKTGKELKKVTKEIVKKTPELKESWFKKLFFKTKDISQNQAIVNDFEYKKVAEKLNNEMAKFEDLTVVVNNQTP